MNRWTWLAVVVTGAMGGCAAADDIGQVPDGASGVDGAPIDASLVVPDSGPLTMTCNQSKIAVAFGAQTPTVACTASSSVVWSVDRGEVGSVNAVSGATASFVPTGTTGGVVNVQASDGTTVVKAPILVQLNGQNGACPPAQIATSPTQLTAGGGIGGVGGEGCGTVVTDAATLNVLANPTSTGGMTWLYPYNNTVWPRGMLAPLLQWSWTVNDADAVQIKLQTVSGSFSWTGSYARPAVLTQTGTAFTRHPIPSDVWTMATDTAGGEVSGQRDDLTVTITVAKNGVGYGPISETWRVAQAHLTGRVYYGSYGSQLPGTDGIPLGGSPAILEIRSGDTAPTVIAGTSGPGYSGCMQCHTVASGGSVLLTQSGSGANLQTYRVDLTAGDAGAPVPISPLGTFTYAALTADGSLAFTNEMYPTNTNQAVTTTTSALWTMGATPAPTTWTGLSTTLQAGYPSFSPDDTLMTYVDATGTAHSTVDGALMLAKFDMGTHAFSSTTQLASPAQVNNHRIGFPVVLPTNNGAVFEAQVRDAGQCPSMYSSDGPLIQTRCGARGELWWTNAAGTPQPARLSNLNGSGYLPVATNDHGIAVTTSSTQNSNDPFNETGWDDTTLNYEPTVAPLAVGGYAWVVFTSRRMYGTVLQSQPYGSADTTSAGITKKLWVAAIDLTAPAGSDPSFPAFYLPAQEIAAGNSRGVWVLDPCEASGASCETGDQCCGGYCESPDGGTLTCSKIKVTCGNEGDQCMTSSDCCNGMQCTGGRCDTIPN